MHTERGKEAEVVSLCLEESIKRGQVWSEQGKEVDDYSGIQRSRSNNKAKYVDERGNRLECQLTLV